MSELNGLRNLIASSGTLGGIEAPPEREDRQTEEEYAEALAAYEARVSPFWKASVRTLNTAADEPKAP